MSKYEIAFDQRFLKRVKKIYKKDKFLYDRYLKFLGKIAKDPFADNLVTHKVNSKNHDLVYSSRVTGDIRVLWLLEEGRVILLLDIGGHEGSNKVYK